MDTCAQRPDTNEHSNDRSSTQIKNVNKGKRKFVSTTLNEEQVDLQFDLAADVTLISKDTWSRIGQPPLTTATVQPRDVQNNPLPILGSVSVDVKLDNTVKACDCLVTATESDLFGIDWIEKFDLWSKPAKSFCKQIRSDSTESFVHHLRTQFPSVFQPGLGRCTAFTAQLILKDDAQPVYRPKRPVPFHVIDQVTAELDRLEQAGIITAPMLHPFLSLKNPMATYAYVEIIPRDSTAQYNHTNIPSPLRKRYLQHSATAQSFPTSICLMGTCKLSWTTHLKSS